MTAVTDVDEIAVERAFLGDRVHLNLAERRELWLRVATEMARNPDWTAVYVARRMHVSRRTVERRVATLRADGFPLPRRFVPHEALKDVDLLRRLYVDEQRSMSDIGLRLGCSYHAVGDALRRHGLPVRTSIHQRQIVRQKARLAAQGRAAA